jgi:hypothetical protein
MATVLNQFRKTNQVAPTTLSNGIGASDTVVPLSSVDGLTEGEQIDIVVDRFDASGNRTPELTEVITGIVSDSGLTGCFRGREQTAIEHSQGARVEFNLSTASLHNDMVDGLRTSHDQSGGIVPTMAFEALNSSDGTTEQQITNSDALGQKLVKADNVDWATLGDQASYLDFGALRIQFGRTSLTGLNTAAGSYNIKTTNLPVPFANNTYTAVVSTTDPGNIAGIAIPITAATTTSFSYSYSHMGTINSSSATVLWIAIGLKPTS